MGVKTNNPSKFRSQNYPSNCREVFVWSAFYSKKKIFFTGRIRFVGRNQVIQHKHLKKKRKLWEEFYGSCRHHASSINTYDSDGRVESSLVIKRIAHFEFSERFVRVRVVRRSFHARPLSDQRLPADYCVQYATVILKFKQPEHLCFYIHSIICSL